MKLTQTGLPAQVREVDRAAADLGHRRAPGPAHRHGTGRPTPEPEAPRSPSATPPEPDAVGDGDAATGDGEGIAIETDGTGAGVGRSTGLGGEGEDPPEHQQRDGDAGQQAGEDRQAWPHDRAEGTSTDGRKRARRCSRYASALMGDRFDFFRTRLLPALLTAGGVTLLAAGLLTYTVPVAAEPVASPSPATDGRGDRRRRHRAITLPPIGSPTPAPPTASPDPNRVATRVRIAALDIDLPVIKGPAGYPPCDVAMYLVDPASRRVGQPGQGRAIYLFAHARPGMFEPLLKTKAPDQRGSVVEVWTSDDQLFLYEIVEVRRGQTRPRGRDRPPIPRSCGSRPRRARRARPARPRSSRSRCPAAPPTRPTPTRRPSREPASANRGA